MNLKCKYTYTGDSAVILLKSNVNLPRLESIKAEVQQWLRRLILVLKTYNP